MAIFKCLSVGVQLEIASEGEGRRPVETIFSTPRYPRSAGGAGPYKGAFAKKAR